jgi:hypothetical protein
MKRNLLITLTLVIAICFVSCKKTIVKEVEVIKEIPPTVYGNKPKGWSILPRDIGKFDTTGKLNSTLSIFLDKGYGANLEAANGKELKTEFKVGVPAIVYAVPVYGETTLSGIESIFKTVEEYKPWKPVNLNDFTVAALDNSELTEQYWFNALYCIDTTLQGRFINKPNNEQFAVVINDGYNFYSRVQYQFGFTLIPYSGNLYFYGSSKGIYVVCRLAQ